MRVITCSAVFLVCASLVAPTSGLPRKASRRLALNVPVQKNKDPSSVPAITGHKPLTTPLRGGTPVQQSLLEHFGRFVLWLAPVLVFVFGIHVTDKIKTIILEGIKFGNLPVVWQSFTNSQLEALLKHLTLAVPALALYHASSFFLFPLKSLLSGAFLFSLCKKAAAVCYLISAPLFGISMVFAFSSLHQVDSSNQLANVIVSVFLVLVTIPCLPWLIWQMEYSGRELKGNPEAFFLPKFILFLTNKINPWKNHAFVQLSMNLYTNILKNVLPARWNQCGIGSLNSLVTAGIYADPSNPPKEPLTEKGLEDISVGIIFNMLYGVLVGINLLSAVTHFGFYSRSPLVAKVLSTGCPYHTSLAQAQFGKVNQKGVIEAVIFLAVLVAALALSTVWGLAILSAYGAFLN